MSEISKNSVDKIIEGLKVKLSAMLPATKVAKLAEMPVVDATGAEVVLSIDGDVPAVGMPVMVGTSPAADGEYKLADGSILVVAGGVVAEIKPVEVGEPKPEEPNPMDALMSRIAAIEEVVTTLKATNTTLEAQLSETKQVLSLSVQAIEEMSTKSVAVNLEAQKQVKTIAKSYQEMSNHEKLLFNKGKL